MSLLFHQAAVREFEKLPPEVRNRVVRGISDFYETRRGDARHIRGALWALRVGDYRVYFGRRGADLRLVGVDHRSRAYVKEHIETMKKRLKSQ